MNEKFLYRIAPAGLRLMQFAWLVLLVGEAYVVIKGLKAMFAGNGIGLLWAFLTTAVLFGLWCVSNYFGACLVTNFSHGYRPWSWGLRARSEFGTAAEKNDVPLSLAQVLEHFAESVGGAPEQRPPDSIDERHGT